MCEELASRWDGVEGKPNSARHTAFGKAVVKSRFNFISSDMNSQVCGGFIYFRAVSLRQRWRFELFCDDDPQTVSFFTLNFDHPLGPPFVRLEPPALVK
jgi:hypothetical protein